MAPSSYSRMDHYFVLTSRLWSSLIDLFLFCFSVAVFIHLKRFQWGVTQEPVGEFIYVIFFDEIALTKHVLGT